MDPDLGFRVYWRGSSPGGGAGAGAVRVDGDVHGVVHVEGHLKVAQQHLPHRARPPLQRRQHTVSFSSWNMLNFEMLELQ